MHLEAFRRRRQFAGEARISQGGRTREGSIPDSADLQGPCPPRTSQGDHQSSPWARTQRVLSRCRRRPPPRLRLTEQAGLLHRACPPAADQRAGLPGKPAMYRLGLADVFRRRRVCSIAPVKRSGSRRCCTAHASSSGAAACRRSRRRRPWPTAKFSGHVAVGRRIDFLLLELVVSDALSEARGVCAPTG